MFPTLCGVPVVSLSDSVVVCVCVCVCMERGQEGGSVCVCVEQGQEGGSMCVYGTGPGGW